MNGRTASSIIFFMYFLVFAEVGSWAPWPGPSLVQAPGLHECPTFFAGFGILLERADQLVDAHDKSIVAAFIVILALSTVLLWITTLQLWKSSDRAGTQQIRDTEILQRAYITAYPLGIGPYRRQEEWIDARVEIRNVDKLPGTTLEWMVCRKFSRNPHLAWFPMNSKRLEGSHVIAPGAEIRKSSLRISIRRLARFKAGMESRNRFLYVWGVVRYKDGFSYSRFTRFCHRYNIAAEVDFRIDPVDARHHEYGPNDAD
jgi:hypothetical protein